MAAEFDNGRSSSSSYVQSRDNNNNNNNLQLDFYHGGKNTWNEGRSYSLDHQNTGNDNNVFENKLKKSKTISNSKVWCFSDPEFKRKKRVASYRAYTVEGKVKGSFKKSFNWIKDKLLYGFW
ncbi:uncharacterized protein [Spinacia oleracea]|uniref:AP2/ERF domain-containing protein n=1 Tax=Spinacia oleracea TaxID=3562 RepID=A0A9R0IX77_SPIOL|nr:uncharacterized protein LOC110795888 [Spinacia oleracea]